MPHDCAKSRIQTESSLLRIAPMNADLNFVQAKKYKNGLKLIRTTQAKKYKNGLKLIRTTLWQNHRLHQIFRSSEPATTPVFIHAKKGEELCLGATELSKARLAACLRGVKFMSGYACGRARSTSSHRF